MAEEKIPFITLLTDFGNRDYFVASMKGVIADINPKARVVDITHELDPHDIIGAAFTLNAAYRYFPKWTIHVAVVDPTVGSNRRPILVIGDQHYFIGPDNGIFSLVYESEPYLRVYHLMETHFFRTEISTTFHGRDIFAPAAAWLSRNVEPSQMGQTIEDFLKIPLPKPVAKNSHSFKGVVFYVDRFGNLITNFNMDFLKTLLGDDLDRPFRIIIKDKTIEGLKRSYCEVAPGEFVTLIGSTGYLEIGAYQSNASRLLGAGRGTEVLITVRSPV